MTRPQASMPSPLVRFPNFTEFGDLNALSIVVQDLSTIYDVTTVAVLPKYALTRMPITRIGPRRRSPLRVEDRLKVKRVSLASPLEIIFLLLTAGGVARAAKAWLDVLAAGQDVRRRSQELEENRALAPEYLHEAQLRNDLLEQRIRRARAEADLMEQAGLEFLDPESASPDLALPRYARPYRPTAAELSSQDIAELLNEPMRRLLAYGGGELQVAGDENQLDESELD